MPTCCPVCYAGPDLIRVHTVGGIAVGMEGNMTGEDIKKLSRSQSRVCGKCHQLVTKLYNPYRIRGPLKRTNPEKGRGIDPKWAEISWDEALNLVAEKLKSIRREKDPRTVAYDYKSPQVSRCRNGLPHVFLRAYGACGDPANPTGPSFRGGAGLHCHMADHQLGNLVHASFDCDVDLEYCNYLITFGENSKHSEGVAANLLASAAQLRGMKEVVIDPYLSQTAAKADEWLPIKPGTDGALLLAMIHVIVNERGVYDVKFLKELTNSPYLVAADGYFFRDKATNKVQVWDPVEGKAKAHDDADIKDFALEGKYVVDGAECRPAFQVLKDHVRQYTPEWASKITEIPAATIRRLAHEYVDNARIGSTIEIDGVTLPYRPVCIKTVGRGITGHVHSYQSDLAAHTLVALVGALEVPGGHCGNVGPDSTVLNFDHAPGNDGMTKVYTYPFVWPPTSSDAMQTLVPFTFYFGTMMHLGLLNTVSPQTNLPAPPAEVWIRYRTNPVTSLGDPAVVEEALKKMFIISFSLVHDEVSPYADIILPENTDLEQWDLFDGFGLCRGGARRTGIAIQQPVVKPAHNTMDFSQFWIELADKMGLLPEFNEGVNSGFGYTKPLGLSGPYRLEPNRKYSWTEIIDRRIRTATNGEHDLEELKKIGAIMAKPPVEKMYYSPLYMTSQKLRYHLPYVECVKKTGEELSKNLAGVGIDWWPTTEYTALPTYFPSVLDEVPPEYDFYVVKARHMALAFGNVDSPWTIELTEALPETVDVMMNEDTAKARGIKDGDEIWIENNVGKIKRKVTLTQGIRPDTLVVCGQWGHWATPVAKDTGRVSQTNLTPISYAWTDKLCGNMQSQAVKAKVYKA